MALITLVISMRLFTRATLPTPRSTLFRAFGPLLRPHTASGPLQPPTPLSLVLPTPVRPLLFYPLPSPVPITPRFRVRLTVPLTEVTSSHAQQPSPPSPSSSQASLLPSLETISTSPLSIPLVNTAMEVSRTTRVSARSYGETSP
jgi:hypothetical protein